MDGWINGFLISSGQAGYTLTLDVLLNTTKGTRKFYIPIMPGYGYILEA